jgi:hypothetical protein
MSDQGTDLAMTLPQGITAFRNNLSRRKAIGAGPPENGVDGPLPPPVQPPRE